jgi:hypothetical protein
MIDVQSLFPELEGSIVTFTGETITIMVRNRDNLTYELKKAMSHRTKCPMHFMIQTKTEFKQEWWMDGSQYNPYGAAVQTVTNTDYLEHHYNKSGQLACEYGPAKIEHRYGKHYREEWRNSEGQPHRDGGPASIEVEYKSPPTSEKADISQRILTWHQRGFASNGDSWSNLTDLSGTETIKKTPDGFIRTLDMVQRQLTWYQDGEKHRTDGPAVIVLHDFKEIEKNGKIRWTWDNWDMDWCIKGKYIPNGKLLKWAKAASIKLWNEPCYDRSMFRNPEDEFYFITDFAE